MTHRVVAVAVDFEEDALRLICGHAMRLGEIWK